MYLAEFRILAVGFSGLTWLVFVKPLHIMYKFNIQTEGCIDASLSHSVLLFYKKQLGEVILSGIDVLKMILVTVKLM